MATMQRREHHYAFAHELLPNAFFDDPIKLIEAFREHGTVYLWFCWDQLGSLLPENERLSKEALDFRLITLNDNITCLIIIMPPPNFMPEAYYVAMLHRESSSNSNDTLTRVITLEKSDGNDGRSFACLCEWGKEHNHLMYRNVLEPNLNEFLAAVKFLLTSSCSSADMEEPLERVEDGEWVFYPAFKKEEEGERKFKGRKSCQQVADNSAQTSPKFSEDDLNERDDEGNTSLITAVENGDTEVVQLLLDKGADIETENYDGSTALIWAAANGHTEVVKLLLDKGANIQARNVHGHTALVMAAAYDRTEVVQLLLDNGADIEAEGFDGQTALSHAEGQGHEEIVKILKKAASVRNSNKSPE